MGSAERRRTRSGVESTRLIERSVRVTTQRKISKNKVGLLELATSH